MDDQKDNLTNAQRRNESVLEQRYKELYGDAGKPPAEDGEAPAPAATPEEPAGEKRAARQADAPARKPVSFYDEDDEPAASPRKSAAPRQTDPPYPRKSAEESGGKKTSSRRVDTLERSTARRSTYAPPRAQKTRLWPWLLAAGVIVAALVILLILSLNRPASAPQATLTPEPTTLPAFLTQPTAMPTPDPALAEPTPNPTDAPTDAPAGTPTPDTNTVLRPGTSGEGVRQMQGRLVELGYLAEGSVDGDYGNTTQAAVVAFQKAHGLTADGFAGQQTLTLLYSAEALPAAAAEE